MNIKNFIPSILNPVILQKIDRYLLLNRPFIWSTRVHYVLYYGLSINITLIFLTVIFIQPDQIDELTQSLVLLLFLLEIGVFFFWMFRQSIFNLEQEHGSQRHFIRQSFLEIIIYVLCILIIFSPSSLISLSAMHKVAYQTKINENTNCTTGIFDEFLSPFEKVKKIAQQEEIKTKLQKLNKDILRSKEQQVSNEAMSKLEREIQQLKELESELKEDYKNKNICSDIQYFTTGFDSFQGDNDSETLPYDIYLFIKAFFISTIGITILIVQKYGNWRSVVWTGLYLAVTSGCMILIVSILDSIGFYFLNFPLWKLDFDNISGNYFIVITVSSLLILFESYRIIKQAKKSRLLIINVGILSIALNFLYLLFWIIVSNSLDYKHYLYDKFNHISDWTSYFKIALLVFICLYHFLKKILLRNLSLPTPK